MSHSDEVSKMTENIYKRILDHFNPSLKNFVASGKLYEKALTGVLVAAKGYFDAMVKLGELASDSHGAKELGDTLFQMAEIHRQIQVELEDMLKLFHSEYLSQLEHKLELDNKYLTSALKRYQSERKSAADVIEHCQSQLKKLRRKNHASHHPNKYSDREMQLVQLMSRHQRALDTSVSEGFHSALTEERRRYCFLVDRHCTSTKIFISYHSKVRELLSQKLSSWQQSCSQPTLLPEQTVHMLRRIAPQSAGAAGIAEVLRQAKLGTAQPLEQKLSVQEVQPLLSGIPNSRRHQTSHSSQGQTPPSQTSHSIFITVNRTPQHTPSHTYTSASNSANSSTTTSQLQSIVIPTASATSVISHNASVPTIASHCSTSSSSSLLDSPGNPNNFQSACRPQAELYATSTLPVPRRPTSETQLGHLGGSLPRVPPISPPTQVEALFPHVPGGGEMGGVGGTCLLHFLPGDTLTLLISEPRDGWHYGQNERTVRRGWFPISYTQPCTASAAQNGNSPPLLSKINSVSTGYLDRVGFPGMVHLSTKIGEDRNSPPLHQSHLRPRPCSVAVPDNIQPSAESSSPPPSPTRTNPFAHVRLRKAVTNDRSAPVIQ